MNPYSSPGSPSGSSGIAVAVIIGEDTSTGGDVEGVFIFHVGIHSRVAQVGSVTNLAHEISALHIVPGSPFLSVLFEPVLRVVIDFGLLYFLHVLI